MTEEELGGKNGIGNKNDGAEPLEKDSLNDEQRDLAEALSLRLSDAALDSALIEINEEETRETRQRLLEKLSADGKTLVEEGMWALCNGKMAPVVAYDSRKGRYLALIPGANRVCEAVPAAISRRGSSPEPQRPPTPEEEPDYWSDHGQWDD